MKFEVMAGYYIDDVPFMFLWEEKNRFIFSHITGQYQMGFTEEQLKNAKITEIKNQFFR